MLLLHIQVKSFLINFTLCDDVMWMITIYNAQLLNRYDISIDIDSKIQWRLKIPRSIYFASCERDRHVKGIKIRIRMLCSSNHSPYYFLFPARYKTC